MKKSYGLQSIDQKITDLLKPIFQGSKKEFILINNLVKNWSELIGKKYSPFCYPKSVNFDKNGKNAKLTIAVYNSSIAMFLESNSEIILEKIASFYGFKSINKIVIKQEPKEIKIGIDEIKLAKEQESFLQEKLMQIEDQELAKTLERLGRQILQEKSNNK